MEILLILLIHLIFCSQIEEQANISSYYPENLCSVVFLYNNTGDYINNNKTFHNYSLYFTNVGLCPIIKLQVSIGQPGLTFMNYMNAQLLTNTTIINITNFLSIGSGESFNAAAFTEKRPITLDPLLMLSLVDCVASCDFVSLQLALYPVNSTTNSNTLFCSNFNVVQVLVNSWPTGSQWAVYFENNGTRNVTSSQVFTNQYSEITNLWVYSDIGNGYYDQPSYIPTLEPGEAITFGYTASVVAGVPFVIISVVCS